MSLYSHKELTNCFSGLQYHFSKSLILYLNDLLPKNVYGYSYVSNNSLKLVGQETLE
jgi:hypothetical protein